MSNMSNIFEENRKRYTHLLFGEDRPDIRDYYNIPKNEEILVFAPIEQWNFVKYQGTVITDRAVYPYMSKEEPIPLVHLCEYLFYQESKDQAVVAICSTGEVELYPRQLRKCVGNELRELLQVFQQNLIAVTPSLRRQYELLLGHVVTMIRKSFHEHGLLNKKAERLLEMLKDSGQYTADVIMIQGENLFRKQEEAAYQRYLQTLREKRESPELVRQLEHPEELFLASYIQDISNPYQLYITQNLISPYAALRKKESLKDAEAMILAYLCVRMDDTLYLHKILNDYGRKLGERQIWKVMCFQARYQNEKMCGIFNRLLSEEPVTATELTWRDSLGLTPLHYALLLRNSKAVEEILELKDWSEYEPICKDEPELAELYDFNFVAAILYENPHFLKHIFLKTSKLAKPLVKAVNQLEQKVYINEKLGNASLVAEYQSTKRDLERELDELMAKKIDHSRNVAMNLFEETGTFAKYMMSIYENSDSLFQVLTGTISDWRLYRHDQHFFLTNADKQLQYSYYEWRNQQFYTKRVKLEDVLYQWTDEEAAQFEKLYGKKEEEVPKYKKYSYREDVNFDISFTAPYGRNWFSAKAHEDLNTLKKEYRTLAKKYHPDNGVNGSERIFQQIMTERTQIIESLK